MANGSYRGLHGRRNPSRGFSLIEVMVSIAILGLLSVIVVLDLNAGKRREELQAGVRVLAADIRALQTRALTAQNIKSCKNVTKNIVCETSASKCSTPGSCTPIPPYGVGLHLTTGGATYTFFADVDSSKNDWKETLGEDEAFFTRNLALSGASNITILELTAPGTVTKSEVHIAFERQNGRMHINPCVAGPACEVPSFTIKLRHDKNGETKNVTVNAATGRVSIE